MARVRVEVPVEPKSEQAVPPTHNQNRNSPGGLPMKKLLVGFVAILGILFVLNLIQERNRLAQELEGKNGSKDTSEIVRVLSRSIELPADELPESRVIEDAGKFTEQNPSLSDIKDGDVLLFYPKDQKVVVYRPGTKKAVVVVKLAQPSSGQPAPNTQE